MRLTQLYQKYGSMHRTSITLQQLEELRDGLKTVDANEVTSLESAQSFLALLRKFREGAAEADKLHGENYVDYVGNMPWSCPIISFVARNSYGTHFLRKMRE